MFDDVSAVGVDLTAVFTVLENDGVAKFAASWRQLLDACPTLGGTAANRGALESRTVDNPRHLYRRTTGPASLSGPAGSQGHAAVQGGHHDRSQSDRHHVCRRVL